SRDAASFQTHATATTRTADTDLPKLAPATGHRPHSHLRSLVVGQGVDAGAGILGPSAIGGTDHPAREHAPHRPRQAALCLRFPRAAGGRQARTSLTIHCTGAFQPRSPAYAALPVTDANTSRHLPAGVAGHARDEPGRACRHGL